MKGLGFSPDSASFRKQQDQQDQHDGFFEQHLEQLVDSVSSHTALGGFHKHVGFSILERLEETIKDGILVAMGDFNEVREAGKRFGSHFNKRQADIFNTFISNASLVDVPLGGVILEKGIPDHRPILLKEHVADFGPTPFRLFHSWLEMEDKKEHLSHLSSIENMIDQGLDTDVDLLNRRESIRIMDDLNWLENADLAQKARIKWASEGDENTSFFHAMLKKNHHQLAIKGILNEGEWIKNPAIIKNIFVDHFRNRFHQSSEPTPYFNVDMPNPISYDQSAFLERSLSRDEIKRAVWDCGGDRAPEPDGFTFKIFTTFWDLLEADVIHFVQAFFLTGSFPKGWNSSFIALIPKVANATLVTDFRPISLIGCQYKITGKYLANRLGAVIGSCISSEQSSFIKGRNILDGPLILNEVITWYRKDKKQLMIFKVDFEKAFDSLRWDFLDLVMAKLDFGLKWREWIKGCLRYARSSVLVNGSPTDEFEISRGLRKGDPLSPFLFILAMEGLHALICKAIDRGIYTGAYIGKDKLRILHLIYADDVIFTGEWSRKNAHNLLCILQCFYLVSGLKINVHKSSIMGICVSDADTSFMANAIGCGESKLPFKYLRVSVGCNMSRVPVSICSKLESMRNKFFIGSEIGEKKMTWIWRFMQITTELWARVIKVIHGNNGGIHVDFLHSPIQASQLMDLQHLIRDVVLTDKGDSWIWSPNISKGYTVASAFHLIENHTLELPSRVNLDKKGIEVD
ncbi:putative RNA-directed DNA polymerase, eukaryota, reverse transcriptase zinc-binding domain protein [Tanacetum coccineum]